MNFKKISLTFSHNLFISVIEQNFLIKGLQQIKFYYSLSNLRYIISSSFYFKIKTSVYKQNYNFSFLSCIYYQTIFIFLPVLNKYNFNLNSKLCLLKGFAGLSSLIKELNYGFSFKLQVYGYIRRSFFKRSTLSLILGRSFTNYTVVPKKIFLKLLRYRFFTFFSNDYHFFKKFLFYLINLDSTSSYKYTGIIPDISKKKLKSKKISSY